MTYNNYWYGTAYNDSVTFTGSWGTDDDICALGYAGDDVLINQISPFWNLFGLSKFSNDYFAGGYGNDILLTGHGVDWLTGAHGNDYLYGDYDGLTTYAFNDFLAPGGGNDYVNGGDEEGIVYQRTVDEFGTLLPFTVIVDPQPYHGDLVYYADADTGYAVYLNLSHSIAYDPWGGVDTLIDIEGAVGTSYDDWLIGDSADNDFIGFRGADYIDGGAGNDTLTHYLVNPGNDAGDQLFGGGAGIAVDLGADYAVDPWWTTDTLVSIENVNGTPQADTLIGSDGDNIICGAYTLNQGYGGPYPGGVLPDGFQGGNDYIAGMGGNDTLIAGIGQATIDGGAGDDLIFAGGSDYLIGGPGSDGFLCDPRDGDGGMDWIADFDDDEDFIIVSSNFIEDGNRLNFTKADTVSVFDYADGSVWGSLVLFEDAPGGAPAPDHWVFVAEVTAAQLADNFVYDNLIYTDYMV